MEGLAGFPQWLVALLEHWHGWVSGGVLAFALELGDRLWDWKPSKKIFAVILGLGLLWSVFAAWRDEHRNSETLITEKADAWSKYNQCDKLLASKTSFADGLSERVISLQGQIANQQDTFNRCIVALGVQNRPMPLMLKVKSARTDIEPESKAGKWRLWILVATTNKTLPSVNGILSCDTQFRLQGLSLAGEDWAMRAGDQGQIDETKVRVHFTSPPWSSDTPLIAAIAVGAAQLGHPNCSMTVE